MTTWMWIKTDNQPEILHSKLDSVVDWLTSIPQDCGWNWRSSWQQMRCELRRPRQAYIPWTSKQGGSTSTSTAACGHTHDKWKYHLGRLPHSRQNQYHGERACATSPYKVLGRPWEVRPRSLCTVQSRKGWALRVHSVLSRSSYLYWDALRSDSGQNADGSAASDLQTGATSRSRLERSRAHDT